MSMQPPDRTLLKTVADADPWIFVNCGTNSVTIGIASTMRLQLRLCLFDHRSKVGAMVIAVKDFHPANHCSFNTQGGWLPEHCIQGTPGSNFIPSVAAALAALPAA